MSERENELRQAIARAKLRAKELGMDHIVRVIAKSGTSDSAGINFECEFDGKRFRATFGAGTNSSSVVIGEGLNPVELYRAADYGRHIDGFREGPWVWRAMQEAENIEKQTSGDAEQERERRLREATHKYEPFND